MPRSGLLVTVLPVVAAATLAACGGTVPEAGVPAKAPPIAAPPPAETAEAPPDAGGFSETTETAVATTTAEPERSDGPDLRPPPIVLVSEGGRQEAVRGSYCITRVSKSEEEAAGVCADTAFPHPDELSVVRPGDVITVTVVGAEIVVPSGCSPATACTSTVSIHPLGCGPDQAVTEFELTESTTTWAVELEPGAYELSTFVYFDDGGGTSGDASGALGLLVDPKYDPDRPYEMPAAIDPFAVCPYPEQP